MRKVAILDDERLPNLRLLVTTGMRNAAIDVEAAKDLSWGTTVGMSLENRVLGVLGLGRLGVRYRDAIEDVAAYLEGTPLRVLGAR